MSGDEQFLARWSRRKHEAKAGHAELAPDEAAEAQRSASPDPAAEPVSSEMELSDLPADLPAIESIDAATDITAFLRKGIPQELSREALRRAWSTERAARTVSRDTPSVVARSRSEGSSSPERSSPE